MKIFDKHDFLRITKIQSNPVVSIFIPTKRKSTNAYKEDILELKNQIKDIKTKLEDSWELDRREIERLMKPAAELLDDFEFWQNNSDLLALFLHDEQLDIVKLPLFIEKSSHFIGNRPFTLPLIPAINHNGHFYILLLNLEKILLYEATRDVIQEIILDPEEVALSFTTEESLVENKSQLHGQGGVGNAGAMFHGHDEGSDEAKKTKILNYFHRMSSMLEPKLNKNPLPLFLAGVDYLIPLYRKASKYNFLQNGHVSGAFSAKDERTLHQKAWELAEPYFSEAQKKLEAEYSDKKAANQTIDNDPVSLIKKAMTGGVETLFIDFNHTHLWGKYNADDHKVELFDEPEKGSHCLIDLAATKVIQSGGKAFLVTSENLPKNQSIKGILRYPIS
ncbi:MAG: hypothetical protein NXH89_14785 [Cyclobacteriaceae bacterium]|uniref:Uncharacterized protein n=1 Tax=Algoriphagus marincola TaxID=264027 RepID=A0ABS7N8W3_9BACT|nr:hypothetical protein [Algoriphagus marincola]MBY5952769.1 hypothetical protein [Algoriphagus marincola]MCR9083691.1 hypothetical protein [Cyclobacteriaceae bacterium]